MKLIELTGQKFGELKIISRAINTNYGQAQWNCICSCGNSTVVSSINLKKGNTKSCGCLKGLQDKTLYSKRTLYQIYKKSALKRGYSFDLNFEQFLTLIQSNCFFCGKSPTKYYKKYGAREGFFVNGIDRLNNNIGYEKNNSVPCCTDCNNAKMNLTIEEFKHRINKCYAHLFHFPIY